MVEKLSAADSWYCSKCKDHVEATKKMELYTTAPYMVLSLNRFKQHNTYFKEKLEDLIKFPISNLNMSKHVLSHSAATKQDPLTPPLIYDLVAVINHFGSMNFGHYTAFAKNSLNGQWYEYNDSTVSMVDADSVCSSAAYVLFYKKRGFPPNGQIDFELLKKAPSGELSASNQEVVQV